MRQSVHASSRFRGLSRLLLPPVCALLAAVAACRSGELAGGVSDSAFVTTMVALERVERTPGLDSSARVAARSAALQAQGLTQAQLEDAAAARPVAAGR